MVRFLLLVVLLQNFSYRSCMLYRQPFFFIYVKFNRKIIISVIQMWCISAFVLLFISFIFRCSQSEFLFMAPTLWQTLEASKIYHSILRPWKQRSIIRVKYLFLYWHQSRVSHLEYLQTLLEMASFIIKLRKPNYKCMLHNCQLSRLIQ